MAELEKLVERIALRRLGAPNDIAYGVLDPLKPERINHLVVALGCLALSVLSIILSLAISTAPYCS